MGHLDPFVAYKDWDHKYNSVPRKVFDKSLDRIDIRIQRIKEDYRNDLVAILARIVTIEQAFEKYFPVEIHKRD